MVLVFRVEFMVGVQVLLRVQVRLGYGFSGPLSLYRLPLVRVWDWVSFPSFGWGPGSSNKFYWFRI